MSTIGAEIALPWLVPQSLPAALDLDPGLDARQLQLAFQRLISDINVQAVVAFGSRATGTAQHDSDLDLAVISKLAQ